MVETFGQALRRFRTAAGLSQPELARQAHISQSSLSRYESDQQSASPKLAAELDSFVQAQGELAALLTPTPGPTEIPTTDLKRQAVTPMATWKVPQAPHSDEVAALELARRVAASDVSSETLEQLETAFDDLAIGYPVASPPELLFRLRDHLAYVEHLLDARKTLAEHKRLLRVGGWFSLLTATVHIDMDQQAAATAYLRTASSLAKHAENDEIRAWCYETEAWRVLTDGDYPKAVQLSKGAQDLAPDGSSVAIQATAQEGRAWARIGHKKETYNSISRVHKLASPLTKPYQAEHHYHYDPDKAVAYTATTLAWVGDPAAEDYARQVITRLNPRPEPETWPRRVASANVDLALTLLATDRLDEACHATQHAIASGRIVPSNYWRVAEVVSAAEDRGIAEARELREAYEDMRER